MTIKFNPYHCGLFIDHETNHLKIAIVWRRVGSKDYGMYLVPKVSADDHECSFFIASYSERGELNQFLIKDEAWSQDNIWTVEQLSGERRKTPIDLLDLEILQEIANAFGYEWLDSEGEEELSEILSGFNLKNPNKQYSIKELVELGLPIKLKYQKMPDFWSFLVESTEQWHFAFLAADKKISPALDNMLIEKMRMFFELGLN